MITTMINEDYVSFEIAKLLKDKGFDEFTFSNYNENGIAQFNEVETKVAKGYQRPTLQMAMKWLREVYNIHIVLHPYTDKEGQHWGFIFDEFAYGCWLELGIYITDSWDTYEQACEVAIKYCLENLI